MCSDRMSGSACQASSVCFCVPFLLCWWVPGKGVDSRKGRGGEGGEERRDMHARTDLLALPFCLALPGLALARAPGLGLGLGLGRGCRCRCRQRDAALHCIFFGNHACDAHHGAGRVSRARPVEWIPLQQFFLPCPALTSYPASPAYASPRLLFPLVAALVRAHGYPTTQDQQDNTVIR